MILKQLLVLIVLVVLQIQKSKKPNYDKIFIFSFITKYYLN